MDGLKGTLYRSGQLVGYGRLVSHRLTDVWPSGRGYVSPDEFWPDADGEATLFFTLATQDRFDIDYDDPETAAEIQRRENDPRWLVLPRRRSAVSLPHTQKESP